MKILNFKQITPKQGKIKTVKYMKYADNEKKRKIPYQNA